MAQTPLFRLPYTNRDFNSVNDAIAQLIPTNVAEWNDFLNSNVGIFIINLFSAIQDLEAFFTDRQGAESFIGTAISRTNVANILQLINYQMRNMIPSTLTERVTSPLNPIYSADGSTIIGGSNVLIPQYTEFSDATGNVRFVSTQDAVIEYDITDTDTTATVDQFGNVTNYTDVPCVQGYFQPYTVNGNGLAGQTIPIPRSDIAEGYTQVNVNGVLWQQAEDNTFVGYASTDTVYRLVVTGTDADTFTSIEFGDGIEGAIPPALSSITITPLVTMGDTARTPTGYVSNIVSALFDSTGNRANASAVNISAASGGEPAQSADDARINFPARFKTLGRAVTKSDFQVLASSFPGVLQAGVYDLNDDPTIFFYRVMVYVTPVGGTASQSLNNALWAYLQSKSVVEKEIIVASPTVVPVAVNVGIYVLKTYNTISVQNAVTAAIRNFFLVPPLGKVKSGKPVSFSQLNSAIQAVPGVSSLVMTSPAADIPILYSESAQLSTATVVPLGTV